MEHWEGQVREVLRAPVTATTDPADMVARVHRGARARAHRRAAGGVLAAVLAVGAAVGTVTWTTAAPDVGPADTPHAFIEVGSDPCCVAVLRDSVFVLDAYNKTLQRIDPVTNRAGKPVPVPANAMARAGDRLGLVDHSTGQASLYDPFTEQLIELDVPFSRGSGAIRGDTLWLGSPLRGELTLVDLETGAVRGSVSVEGVSNFDAMSFAADGTLWASTKEGEVVHVDLDRRVVLHRHDLFTNEHYVSLTVADDSVVVAAGGIDRIIGLDATTGEVRASRRIELSAEGFGPGVTQSPEGVVWLYLEPDRMEVLDPRTLGPERTYRVPPVQGVETATQSLGGMATGFGSLWVTVTDGLSRPTSGPPWPAAPGDPPTDTLVRIPLE